MIEMCKSNFDSRFEEIENNLECQISTLKYIDEMNYMSHRIIYEDLESIRRKLQDVSKGLNSCRSAIRGIVGGALAFLIYYIIDKVFLFIGI